MSPGAGDNLPQGPQVVRAALLYHRLGWTVVPIPVRGDGTAGDGKNPNRAGWQELRLTPDEIPRQIREGDNLGLILGMASNHLTDVDLDCPQAVRAAPYLLPQTIMRHGRKTAGCSHYWYRCPDLKKILKILDPEDGTTLIEVRYGDKAGLQTVVPPSMHVRSQERLLWIDRRGAPIMGDITEAEAVLAPLEVKGGVLLSSARQVATAAMLARAMPPAGQHEYAMAVAGHLARSGYKQEDAQRLVRAMLVAGEREERRDEFERVLADTYQRLRDGREVQGAPSLAGLIGEKRMKRLGEWLGGRDTPLQLANGGPGGAPEDGGHGGPPHSKGRTGVNPYRYEVELLLQLTDEGNAQRFLRRFGAQVLHCELLGGWHIWDAEHGRWLLDENNTVRDLARQAADESRTFALNLDKDIEVTVAKADGSKRQETVPAADARALCCHWAGKTAQLQRMEAMLQLAAAGRSVAVTPDELDEDPWLLNVNNCTLDLRYEAAGQPARPHSPTLRITKLAPVDHAPEAHCPLWEKFLEEVFLGDKELIAFAQRLAGYMLFGGNPEQVIAFLWGGGGNGKGVFKDTLSALLGDYAATAQSETILASSGGNNNQVYQLAKLKGARLVTMSEADPGRTLAESLVKVMTGGDPISARKSHQDFFTFTPEFLPVMATNNMPQLRNVDAAIKRRVLLVPFKAEFSYELGNRDAEIGEKLRDELPGILNWALAGLTDYHERNLEGKRGLAPPPSVCAATAEYFEEQDPIATFLEDRCTLTRVHSCTKGALYKAYAAYCEDEGLYQLRQNKFGSLVKRMLAGRYNVAPEDVENKSGSTRWWVGIALTDEPAGEGPLLR